MPENLGYDPHEAFARDLLTVTARGAVTGSARAPGYTVDCPPRQVAAEGVDVHTNVLWRVHLSDVMAAAKTFAADLRGWVPGGEEADDDRVFVTEVGTALAAIHADLSRGIHPPQPDLAARIDRRAAELIFQLATPGQVSYP